jgi:hypothetical protein
VDSKDEEEEEVWVKAKDRSYVTTVCNHDTLKGTIKTLALLASTAVPSNML